MKLEPFEQGAVKDGTIEPRGPGRCVLTINNARMVKDSGDSGVKLRFKKFNDDSVIDGTADPQIAEPKAGGRLNQVVFELGSDVTNALVRNLGTENVLDVEVEGLGNCRTAVLGGLTLGDKKAEPKEIAPFAPPPKEPQPKQEESVKPAQSVPPASEKKGHGGLIALIIALALLLILSALAAWWFLFHGADETRNALETAQQEQSASKDNADAGDADKQAPDGAAQNQNAQSSDQADDNTQNAADQGTSSANASDNAQNANSSDAAPAVGAADGANTSSSGGSVCSVSASGDDQALLKGCLATNPDDKTLMGLAKDALSNNRCNVGVRLLTSLGRSGKQDFALYYAKLADPNTRDASACIKKNAQGAKYWYEKALDAGQNDEATQALEKLK